MLAGDSGTMEDKQGKHRTGAFPTGGPVAVGDIWPYPVLIGTIAGRYFRTPERSRYAWHIARDT